MKTSNIILLSGFIFLLAGMLVMAILVRDKLIYDTIEEGDGIIKTKEIEIREFDKLSVSGNFRIFYTQDTVTRLKIETDSNILEHVYVDIENNNLKISHGRGFRTKGIKVHLSHDKVEEVTISGGSRFVTKDTIKLPELNLIANAGSRYEVSGNFDLLDISLNAGSFGTLSGKSKYLKISATAGSNLKAEELVAEEVEVNASAGSRIDIISTIRLDVSASAGSRINYKGDPEFKNIETSSGASVNQKR